MQGSPLNSTFGSHTKTSVHLSCAACSVFLVDHAWTYRMDYAREQLEQTPGLLQRMAALMGVDFHGEVPDEHTVELVMEHMWKYNQTYHLGLGVCHDVCNPADTVSSSLCVLLCNIRPVLCSLQKRRFRCGTSWMSSAPRCSTQISPAVAWHPSSTFQASWPTLCCGLCRTCRKEVNTHTHTYGNGCLSK